MKEEKHYKSYRKSVGHHLQPDMRNVNNVKNVKNEKEINKNNLGGVHSMVLRISTSMEGMPSFFDQVAIYQNVKFSPNSCDKALGFK